MRIGTSFVAVSSVAALRSTRQQRTLNADVEAETLGFERFLQASTAANLDPSMTVEDAVMFVGKRGVPKELAEALHSASLTTGSQALASLVSKPILPSHKNATQGSVAAVHHEVEEADSGVKVNAVMKRIFKIINGMIIEDQNKLVLKVFDCMKQEASFNSAYRANRMNFYDEGYKLQEAVSSEKHGQVEQFEADERLRHLVPTRKETQTTCDREIEHLQGEFERISYDFDLARKIADGTSCAAKPDGNFLQTCERMVSTGKRAGFVQFVAGTKQRKMVSLMQTETGRAAVARGLFDVAAPRGLEAEEAMHRPRGRAAVALLQTMNNYDDVSEEADELEHRESLFRDYYFQDGDYQVPAGVVEGTFRPSKGDQAAVRQATQAQAHIRSETHNEMRNLDPKSAPPNFWISQAELDGAAKQIAFVDREEPSGSLSSNNGVLPDQNQTNNQAKDSAKFFCTVAGNPNCPRFRDRLEMIVAELMAEKLHTEHLLETTKSECKSSLAELDTQIGSMTNKKNDGARIESEASAVKSAASGTITAIESQGRKLLSESTTHKAECKTEIQNLRNSVCGTKKLKQEVIAIEAKKRDGEKLEINDCSVSDWSPGECINPEVAKTMSAQGIYEVSKLGAAGTQASVLHPCGPGGGVQWYLREPVSPAQTPELGADCPPLRLKTVCNDHECPVNCVLGDWEGWSACTKSCDGGLKRRVRSVGTYPQWGGAECDATKQEETCNALSCDRPCTLNDWGPWRQCTRACEGGIKWRSRDVKVAATGAGKCARTFSKARYETQACNEGQCPMDVMCIGKMDLVVALDSSGSMGDDGWKGVKEGLLGLIGRMEFSKETGMQMGVLKFSWEVEVVEQLTDDKDALISAVEGMKFDAYTTNIGGAFRSMKNMLQFGRRAAPSVCMLWTDGRPSYPSNDFDAASGAAELRTACRVMVVTMRPAIPREAVLPWVSNPKEQNILSVQSPEEMENSVRQVNTFVCARVQKYLDWTNAKSTEESRDD
mmetsp:Transcript_30119/g.66243  ORF Transcript_30119/g.66243 Transcript_30119/m.66243 type:complete len:1002 (-) Transcript_30119:54-3059(-)